MRKILKSIYCFFFGCSGKTIKYNLPEIEELVGLEKEYLDVINGYRTGKVKAEKFLRILAFQHSFNMSATKDISHYEWDERVKKINAHFGDRSSSEIIAYNFSTPASTLNAWLHSPGHKAVLDNDKFNYAGIGLYKDTNGKVYVTIIFAKL